MAPVNIIFNIYNHVHTINPHIILSPTVSIFYEPEM